MEESESNKLLEETLTVKEEENDSDNDLSSQDDDYSPINQPEKKRDLKAIRKKFGNWKSNKRKIGIRVASYKIFHLVYDDF
jgi:hypothetical protein